MDKNQRPRRLGGALGASLALHLGLAVAILFVLSFPPATASSPEPPVPLNVVYLPAPGPSGGGGGRPAPAPKQPLSVPPHEATPPVPVASTPPPVEPPPPTLDAQIQTDAGDLLRAVGVNSVSLSGGGGGRGSGLGPGAGPGLGDGTNGGRGGGPAGPGNDVTAPVLLKQVEPTYTSEAMVAKIQGSVRLSVVVRADGAVGDVEVVGSLDQRYGLDDRAVAAARQWRFKPGLRMGQPVETRVTIILEFRLH
ncbi:MAG TPA: energy transducer TonB [Vicinamibacterales bacterium]|nr:energy transducer TonB [Vicinamibacterales bacterium]